MTAPAPRTAPGLLLLSATLLLAACGGGESGGAPDEMAQDTLIKPMERVPLTEADLGGIDVASLALELPWSANKVTRDAAAGAPASNLRSAGVEGHDGYDRVTFTLDDALPVTGYHLAFAEAGDTVACGAERHTLEAPRTLVVTFSPARAGADGERWITTGVARTGATRMARAGVLCDDGTTVVWTAELERGEEARVLELREPGRVVVDVR